MILEIRVPNLGEVNTITIVKWLKETGDLVEKDEVIAEVDSDKAYITINAPESGQIEVLLDCEEVEKEQLIARIDTSIKPKPKIKNIISPNDIVGRF